MNSLGKSLELLDEYCSAVGASSASVEDVAGCLHHVDRLEAELDATINVLNIRNELQRKALERTKLHCDQKLRSVDMKLGQKAKLETTYTVKSVEHVASGKENCQDESKMKAIQFTLLSRGYSEDLDNEEEGAALQETIKSLNQRSAQLRSELALFHDLPQSIPEANAMLQKVRNRRS